MSVVAWDDYPSATITYQIWKVPDVVNNTNNTSNKSNDISDRNNTYETIYLAANVTPPKPQYGIYMIMAIISIGILAYLVVSLATEKP